MLTVDSNIKVYIGVWIRDERQIINLNDYNCILHVPLPEKSTD